MDVHALKDFALRIPLDWLIGVLVLTSMLLQILLVVCGARRYRNSNPVLRFIVWVAYISADAIAISALGTMMHYARNETYGIWAPLLLVHLGGPDAITAYSPADNELWLRHGFYMLYHVSLAVYVIYVSAFTGYLLWASILVQIAGFCKYAERTVALAFASYSQIVNSTQPIDMIMKHEEEIAREVNSGNEIAAPTVNFEENTVKEVNSKHESYIYPVMGEKILYDKLQNERYEYTSWKSLLQGNGVVTIKDVCEHEVNRATDDYMLCLSYALFKLYKRRFVGLYFNEGPRQKTRRLFLNDHLTAHKLFKIVEMELKFVYDFLFSKSSLTAFSLYGALRRFLSACFLAVAGFLIFSKIKEDIFQRMQRTIMYVLLSVAFFMEIYHLCRIILSDWAMVRLICMKIQHKGHHICIITENIIALLGKVRMVLGDQYWSNQIHQYSMVDTCLKTRSSHVWKLPDSFVSTYFRNKHIGRISVPDDLKEFMFEKLKDLCSPEEEIARCRERVYAPHQCLFEKEYASDLQWMSEMDLDNVILALHIATAICEHEGKEDSQNFNVSTILSRYCAYLLLSHPNLLPLHPDTARMAYMKLHRELVKGKYRNVKELNKVFRAESKLGKGTKLARKLLKIEKREKMWKLLADYWAALLLYIAVYNKAEFHAQCLVTGGQFLTQLWVLLGHMGCGEQSDSAVTKKVEDKTIREKEDKDSRSKDERKSEENKWRENIKQVRRQKLKRSKLEMGTVSV